MELPAGWEPGAIAENSLALLTHDHVGSLFYEDGQLINAEEWLLRKPI